MTHAYIHHQINVAPREWQATADALGQSPDLKQRRGTLYGVWRSQIGRPRDELNAITVWPDVDAAKTAGDDLFTGIDAIVTCNSAIMTPTLRPKTPEPPRRQGNYAFRWFETPPENWREFLDLCEAAWPGFESAYDSQIIGMWRFLEDNGELRRTLLMTRRPNLAVWERSKIPQGEAETEVRRQLSRRYDLCDATHVFTTTLLTADDSEDSVRWA
ncbi:MAG: hypothetical protein HOM25_18055 [Rhodospirillaceae bacterium]|jgi:hypothetical protein|nr:hypothetical protein [Rhodospirillaceae bacterium]MBT5664900.1 hypothetical protein [Rhodospirillaceae bacterium]MBT5811655.1 hypothetical protein [Rhodospirillaceae bacterium]